MDSLAVLDCHLRADSAFMHTFFGLGRADERPRAWRPWELPYSSPDIDGNYVSGSRNSTETKGCWS